MVERRCSAGLVWASADAVFVLSGAPASQAGTRRRAESPPLQKARTRPYGRRFASTLASFTDDGANLSATSCAFCNTFPTRPLHF